jgi:hypothetical protein
VDAAKDTRIEILFEFGHTAAQHMGSGSDVEAGIVICGPDPVNLGGLEKQDLAVILYGDAFGGLGCRPVIPDLVLRAGERVRIGHRQMASTGNRAPRLRRP